MTDVICPFCTVADSRPATTKTRNGEPACATCASYLDRMADAVDDVAKAASAPASKDKAEALRDPEKPDRCPGCHDEAVYVGYNTEDHEMTWLAQGWPNENQHNTGDQGIDFCPFCGLKLPDLVQDALTREVLGG